jgi:DNA sulfur modification protein DndC
MKPFYAPIREMLTKLSQPWCAAFSGGKDSTALVTYVEWLRRSGWIDCPNPKLVQSDTGVEDIHLTAISSQMLDLLRNFGWECAVVRPEVHERLYCQILGRGLTPIHPGVRSFRWCSRSTKKDPMQRWRDENARGLTLTGLRWGESQQRDGKLIKAGCETGGECGIPDADGGTYSPIINWRTCWVIDWLNGAIRSEDAAIMQDVFAITRKLVDLYDVRYGQPNFDGEVRVEDVARFGCQGCPAIEESPNAPKRVAKRNGIDSPLNELYAVWHEARKPHNRIVKAKGDGRHYYGALRMEARKRLFDWVMDIQRRSGVTLISHEDEAFIRQCWKDEVYPTRYTPEDELRVMPDYEMPLFDN